MRPRRSLVLQSNVDDVLLRLGRLQPTTPRQWGTMTPHEMLCHVADSFAAVLGDRQVGRADTWWSRTLVKWVALHTPLPWPPGIPTRPEVDPRRGGTRPDDFERDRQHALALLRRFAAPDAPYKRHPFFGAMMRKEWLLWGYGHVDHHLRQFGM